MNQSHGRTLPTVDTGKNNPVVEYSGYEDRFNQRSSVSFSMETSPYIREAKFGTRRSLCTFQQNDDGGGLDCYSPRMHALYPFSTAVQSEGGGMERGYGKLFASPYSFRLISDDMGNSCCFIRGRLLFVLYMRSQKCYCKVVVMYASTSILGDRFLHPADNENGVWT